MNDLCQGFFGKDARTIAIGTVVEDIDHGALKQLRGSAVEAVAALLGDASDKNTKIVARAIIDIVRSRV